LGHGSMPSEKATFDVVTACAPIGTCRVDLSETKKGSTIGEKEAREEKRT